MEVEDLFDRLTVTEIDMLREDFMASNLDGNHLVKTAKPRERPFKGLVSKSIKQ